MILKAQNVATPTIAEVATSFTDLRKVTLLTSDAFLRYNDSLGKTLLAQRAVVVDTDLVTAALRRQIVAVGDLALVQRAAQLGSGSQALGAGSAAIGSATARVAAQTAARDSQLAFRTGIAGVTGSGGFTAGPLSGGSSVLGSATIPLVVAAVAGYLGFKAVSTANQYNQSVADIVANSSQNKALIPAFQQGILNLAGNQNRFTPQDLVTAAYPIASAPAFGDTAATFLNALKVVSEQAQASGPKALPALASADVGAANAFRLTSATQFAAVADIISKGVNVGLAEPTDFAKGIGTFAPSAYVAGLTGETGLAQASGLFASSSLLNPKFRFDAQAQNALFLSVTNKQTAGAAAAAKNLQIQNLFGVGAIGAAGGLPQWLTDLNTATAGPRQQEFLATLFPRQNALQAIRGATGANLGNALSSIAANQNFAGTVAAGAGISDAGPQAQFDQMRSQFSKDVILIGDTISKTLNPDLLLLGTGALNAAGKLGDLVGAIGDGIDKLSIMLNLPSKVQTAVGDAGAVGNAIGSALTSFYHFGSGGNAPAIPGVGEGINRGQADSAASVRRGAGVHAGALSGVGYTANPTITLPGADRFFLPTSTGGVTSVAATAAGSAAPRAAGTFVGPAAPATAIALNTLTTTTHAATGALSLLGTALTVVLGHTALALQGSVQGLPPETAAQRAAIQAYAYAQMTASKNAGAENRLLQSDRGSINYELTVKAAGPVLDAAVAKLKSDLADSGKTAIEQRNYIQKYAQPVTNVENQRLVDAANLQVQAATIFSESVRVHHGSTQQQQQAVNRQYSADVSLANVMRKTGKFGTGEAAHLGYQDAINKALDTLALGNTAVAQGGLGKLQDRLTLDKLTSITGASTSTAADIKTISAYMTANAKALGLDPTQLQIGLLQLQQQNAIAKTAAVQLIRPHTAGAGGLVDASFGQSVASLAGGGAVDSRTAQLERENAALRQQVAYLEQLLNVGKASDAKLGVIAGAVVKSASANTRNSASPTSKDGSLRSIARHH